MQKSAGFIPFFKSLKFRLIISIILMSAIPVIIVITTILTSYEARALSIRESEVKTQTKILANQIGASEHILDSSTNSEIILAQINMLTTIYNGRVMIVGENMRILYDTFNLSEHKTIISEEVIRSFRGEEIANYDPENRYIEMAVPIQNPGDPEKRIQGVLVVSVSTGNIQLNAEYLQQIAIIMMVIILIAIAFFGVLLSNHLVAPFRKLSLEIDALQGGGSDDELMVRDYTETIMICEKFNHMMSKMKIMDDSRQEFVSNVSHELKTPLTSMKVLADSINSMQGAPVELYQEFMSDITNEIERETKIINDLLSLVKMDKTAKSLNITSVHMNDLIEQIMRRLQPIADKQRVRLVMESFRPVTADVDEVKMTLAITNLIENAIKYNKADGDGWVHVSLNADHKYFYIKVEDSGMGIPKDALEQIYERFYRVDKSHSREIGGTGLGLAITRSAILMHKGVIKVHSELGEGTTFDVRVPLNYIGS